MIHSSFSKKDLCDVIKIFHLETELPIYKKLNKEELGVNLNVVLKSIPKITPNLDYYPINDVDELQEYLSQKKPELSITLKEREIAINKAKDIIHYAKDCGYTFGNSRYNDISEVLADGSYIQRFGDIPTIRRALIFLNEDLNHSAEFIPQLSYKMTRQLEKKKKNKKGALSSVSFRRGHFSVAFD